MAGRNGCRAACQDTRERGFSRRERPVIILQVLAVWIIYGVLTVCLWNLTKWHVRRRSR